MSFIAYTAGEIDADSPLDEAFFLKMSNNFDALNGADVTNGDAHNHEGGDGALIPFSGGLDLTTIAVDSDGNQVIATTSTWTPAVGVYQGLDAASPIGGVGLELFISGAWRKSISGSMGSGFFSCFDGSNMRIANNSGSNSSTIYWQKF